MKDCQCESHGYCEFFKQEMTSNPPNWQWCQGATEAERLEYKKVCDVKQKKKQALIKQSITEKGSKFLTLSNLVDDCIQKLVPKLNKMDISGVVGIPRSGLLPASICATALNIPLYTLSDRKLIICNSLSKFGGWRMGQYEKAHGKLLLLDDTIFTGNSLATIKKFFDKPHYTGVLYANPTATSLVDVFGEELDIPHLLEWHFFNSDYLERTLFDLDGVFSPNVPISECLDDDKYEKYISNVEPFYHRLPKAKYKLKAIVTGRTDRFRKITEQWLEKHNIEYQDLIMFPAEREKERNRDHVQEVGKYKADIYRKFNVAYFMESEKSEGLVIRELSKKQVILPNQGMLI